jgi:hypothetical protein
MKGQFCGRCNQTVKNPCIHDSQVKWCKQKAIMSASEVYGSYETTSNGVVIEKGVGPFDVIEPFKITKDFITFFDGLTTTKVKVSSISI